jgi:hypothetical protein
MKTDLFRLFWAFAFLAFASCELTPPPPAEIGEKQFEEVFRKIGLADNAPLMEALGTLRLSGSGPASPHRTAESLWMTSAGLLDINQVVERIAQEGQANYSIRIDPSSSDEGTIEYLVVVSTNGGYVGYVMQFEPEVPGSHLFQDFTGTIRILDLDRAVQSESHFEQGQQTAQGKKSGRTATTYENCDCAYVFEPVYGPITGTVIGHDVWIVCDCDGAGGGSGDGGGIGTPIGGSGPDSNGDSGGGTVGGGGSGETIGFEDLEECLGENQTYDVYGNCVYCQFGVSNDGECYENSGDAWEEEYIDYSQLHPCLNRILSDLKTLSQGVGQTLQLFAGNTAGYNWKVKDGDLSQTQATGQTSSSYDIESNTVTTVFDSQSWPNATDLSWARTILHEVMHAYLVAYYSTNRSDFIGTYSQMVEDWNTYQNWPDVHHEEFARSLVTGIADALEEYGNERGYVLDRQFYEDMSWAGLHNTTAFQRLPQSTRNRILNRIAVELTGKNINGVTTTQQGSHAGCND